MLTSAPTAAPSARASEPVAPARLLVVDDEETIRLALSRFLRMRGFDVEPAGSGPAALAALGRERFLLMICDVRMPGMSGMELVPQALAVDPDLAVIMLSAVNDAPTATEALARGAADYLVKPVELLELHDAVERALHKRMLQIEQRRVEQMVREEVAIRTRELEQEKEALRELTVSIAESLIAAMEAKDVYLRGHSHRVAELAASMATIIGLNEDSIEAVRLAGRLHDVGKIGTREEVLNKPGPLTPEEFAHVQQHVAIGLEILAPLKHLGVVLEYVHDHHEHVDGTGYPRQLKGEAISIGGRILAAADAFDAVTSKRAYREPLTPAAALELLGGMVGTLLDPAIFQALRTAVTRRRSLTFIA